MGAGGFFRVLDGCWIGAGCFSGCWKGAGWVLDGFSGCWMGAGWVLDGFFGCWMGAELFFRVWIGDGWVTLFLTNRSKIIK